tara:strand:+ start:9116 stop:9736 length:621 start_codon:yes stop_codon:yes gene_type:complete
MKKLVKINKVRIHPDNPRVIKDEKFRDLVRSLKDFPEMMEKRPIVVNEQLYCLGGNMRLRAAREAGMKEVWIDIAQWSEEKQKEFIIKDNVRFGEWNHDILANEWDQDELKDWGYEFDFDKKIDLLDDDEEIEITQSVQLDPPKEYILIMADPNSVEWEDLKETLKLKMVARGGYKKGSAFEKPGLERVIYWNEFKKRIYDHSSSQ